MRHILELSREEKGKFINSFDIIFSDCDGVLWLASEPIKNTGVAVNLLIKSNKKFICVSNNSMRTDEEYKQKLNELGIRDVNKQNFVHPIKSISHYLKKINFNGPIFSIVGEVLNKSLENAGYEVIKSPYQNFTTINEFADYIKTHTKKLVKAVILDIDFNMSMSKLVQAQYFLNQSDCIFIVGASDRFIPLYKGLNVIAAEPFIELLSDITGKHPIILGKPGKLLGEYLIEYYNVKLPQRALFIGDALKQDIGFGNDCGFQTLAVLSGATSKNTLFQHKNKNEIPNFYADSMADFIEFFKDIQ